MSALTSSKLNHFKSNAFPLEHPQLLRDVRPHSLSYTKSKFKQPGLRKIWKYYFGITSTTNSRRERRRSNVEPLDVFTAGRDVPLRMSWMTLNTGERRSSKGVSAERIALPMSSPVLIVSHSSGVP